MEPAPLLLLLLLLGSPWGCSGRPADGLVLVPPEPVVRFGGSAQLNCSLACADGTVQWKGLDTNVESITSFPTHSILHISNAAVATGGTKSCHGTCHGQRYQRTVNLRVYALPDALQLEATPRALEPGQPGSLRCSAGQVYPLTGLVLSWYRGDQALPEADFDVTETEEELFNIVSMLPVAGEEVGEGVEFRCEVTLSIGQENFTRVASVAVSAGAVTEQPVAVATSTGSPWPAAALTGALSTARPVTTTALPPEPSVPTHHPSTSLTATAWEPDAKTVLEPAAATEPPSPERPVPRDPLPGSPTARPATTTLPDSGTASPGAEAQGTAAGGLSGGSTPAAKGTGTGTVPACSLRIWSLPPNGTRGRALRIECRARCGGNATVRWLRTPVALSQYREEAAGSGSTLRLDHAEPRHQGHYQCVLLGHRSQAASLQLTVSDDPLSTGPAVAVGSTVSLLGLIVTGVVSRRLWKRFRARYELP
ncbi:mucosal addressin cell adhesion molecule 1 [Strix uralensis]|uniref:mucosal addressin cell adhesion molecule 1 n=1 Tax=Strix uralensis TaxID=36305 RepID=UPI003DA6CFAC